MINAHENAAKQETDAARDNERISNILESITDAFFAVDPDWSITYANRLAAKYLKKEPADLMGRNLWSTFPQLVDTHFFTGYHQAMSERVVVEFEDFSPLTGQHYEVRAFPAIDGGLAVYYRNITGRKAAEAQAKYYAQELEISRAQLQQLVDNAEAGIWSLDPRTNEFTLSHGVEKLYGYPNQAFYDNPNLWRDVIHPDDIHKIVMSEEDIQAGKTTVEEIRIYHVSGEERVLRNRLTPVFDSDGKLIKLVGICVDITKQQRMEQSIRESREWLSTTLNGIGDGVVATDVGGKVTFMNPVAESLTAWTAADAMGRDIKEILCLVNECTRAEVDNPVLQVIKGNKIVGLASNTVLINKDGVEIPIDDSAAPIRNDQGDMIGIVMVFRDVMERKRYEEQIKSYAYHDALTGLPNRRLCHDRLTMALAQAKRNGQTLATLFMDVDHFKSINDTYGHEVGDALLQEVASRLSSCVREGDTVARLGGDEFIIVLQDIDEQGSTELAERMMATLTENFCINGHELTTSPSIGISFFPRDGEDAETLIKNADMAMYVAKKNGKNAYQFFSSFMNDNALRRWELDKSLREALDKQEFELHYQSKVDLMTGEFLGVEALIRWNHPTLGKISPAEFIPIAEEIGLIGRIGEWVLETACTQCKEWQATGYPAIRVAVNVSTLQFQHDLIGTIKRVLFTTGLAPEALELEITESVMHNKATISKLTEIKQMGISISVDDFGTGYSSLSYLKRLPIDALKIDRSFICDIDADETDTDIVRAIISLAKSLNLKIVAEGVETDEQLQFVKLYQCDEAQGYLINEPVPAEQFEMMLKRVHLVSARIVEKTGIPAAAGFNRRL